jgi:DNA-binding transcriptional LysR family regulator
MDATQMCENAHQRHGRIPRVSALQWDDVRVLLALLRGKNLADGGARLGIDRTTVSRRLGALEKTLGVKLFARTREGLRPTAAAERLRAHAEAMETEATALAHVAAAGEQKATGVVRVATTEAMSVWLVMQGLLAVRDQHPDLMIELLGGNRPVDLTRGEADVALRVSKVTEASLKVRCVARMAIGLFASPTYLRARGLPRTAAALRGHDVLLPAAELANLPEAKWLAVRARDGARVVFRSSSMPALASAAAAGAGITALTLPWGDGDPGLERVMVIDDLPKRPIWLVTSAEATTRAAVRVVCDRIAAIYARGAS